MRSQPERPLIVFQNRFDGIVRQTVLAGESRKVPRLRSIWSSPSCVATHRVPLRSSQMAFTLSWLRLAGSWGLWR